jgi:hypothetical protein
MTKVGGPIPSLPTALAVPAPYGRLFRDEEPASTLSYTRS